jgi:hypothetical protein
MKTLLLTTMVLLLTPFARAQEPALKPVLSAPKAETPTYLSLEIDFKNSLPPAYISVRGPETKPRWIWAARFARIPGAKLDPGALPIQAIRVESQFNGETADVKVSLLRGRNGFEREDPVATYHIGLDEKATVTELKSYGLEPIDLLLFTNVPPLPPAPVFENRTTSVAVVSVESNNLPLPTYKLTFRNQSEKSIRALKIEIFSDGRLRTVHLWQNEFDRPVLEAGGTGERILPAVVAKKGATAYAPGTGTNNTIVISSAVFDDLTFDGEEQPACQYERFVVGRRLWIKRVLPLIESELANPAISAKEFKEKFLALSYTLEESEKAGKSAVSSNCKNPDEFTYIATQNLTIELVRELNRIINTRPSPPVNFRAWLETRRDNYKAWLARLQ